MVDFGGWCVKCDLNKLSTAHSGETPTLLSETWSRHQPNKRRQSLELALHGLQVLSLNLCRVLEFNWGVQWHHLAPC